MTSINFKREIPDTVDHAIERVTKALGAEGFGVVPSACPASKFGSRTSQFFEDRSAELAQTTA